VTGSGGSASRQRGARRRSRPPIAQPIEAHLPVDGRQAQPSRHLGVDLRVAEDQAAHGGVDPVGSDD